jgi:hypothetical protein
VNDSGENDLGICQVGAGGPCNDQPDDGTDNESLPGDRIGEGNQSDDGSEAGICLVGAGGPCNGSPMGLPFELFEEQPPAPFGTFEMQPPEPSELFSTFEWFVERMF